MIRGTFYWPKGNMLILLRQVAQLLFNNIASNINTTTVTAITTMLKAMKVKFSRNFEGRKSPNMLSSKQDRNALEMVDGIKPKLSTCVESDAEENKGAMGIVLLMLLQILRTLQARVPSTRESNPYEN